MQHYSQKSKNIIGHFSEETEKCPFFAKKVHFL